MGKNAAVLKNEYKQTLSFCKSLLPLFWLAAGVLVLSAAVVYLYMSQKPAELEKAFLQITGMLAEKGVLQREGWSLFLSLLFNNFRASAYMVALGIIPFLFIPLVSIAMNGGIIGITFAIALPFSSFGTLMTGILPHGIFELPALFLSSALGMHLCWKILRRITGKPWKVMDTLHEIFRAFVLLVFPLLVLAAFFETFITPWLMGAAM